MKRNGQNNFIDLKFLTKSITRKFKYVIFDVVQYPKLRSTDIAIIVLLNLENVLFKGPLLEVRMPVILARYCGGSNGLSLTGVSVSAV
jgi:hypothetical protein